MAAVFTIAFIIAFAIAAVAVSVLLAIAIATAAAGFAIAGLLVACVALIAWRVSQSKKRLTHDRHHGR